MKLSINKSMQFEHEPIEEEKENNQVSNNLQLIQSSFDASSKYIIVPIYSQLSPSELLYVTGEIIVDFGQRGKGLKWDSPWNQVKRCERVECDFKNEIVIVEFAQEVTPFVEFRKQAGRFNIQPDLELHLFGQSLLQYEIIYRTFQDFTKASVQRIKSSEDNLNKFYSRKEQFNQIMRIKCKQMNETGQHFYAAMMWPSLASEIYVSQKLIYSKNLGNLLGVSQQSFQNIINRKGVIEYYEFETSLAINRRVTESIVNHFLKLGGNLAYQNFSQFEDLDKDEQLKFCTFDEIEFLAKIRIEYVTLDGLLGLKPEEYQNDFYGTIIHVEPSQQTFTQIETIRKQMKNQHSSMLRNMESDFAYTIQSENFVSHLYQQKQQKVIFQSKVKETDKKHKKCGIKQIKETQLNFKFESSSVETTDNTV